MAPCKERWEHSRHFWSRFISTNSIVMKMRNKSVTHMHCSTAKSRHIKSKRYEPIIYDSTMTSDVTFKRRILNLLEIVFWAIKSSNKYCDKRQHDFISVLSRFSCLHLILFFVLNSKNVTVGRKYIEFKIIGVLAELPIELFLSYLIWVSISIGNQSYDYYIAGRNRNPNEIAYNI